MRTDATANTETPPDLLNLHRKVVWLYENWRVAKRELECQRKDNIDLVDALTCLRNCAADINRLVPRIIRTFALPDARKSAMTFPPVNRKSEIVLLKLLPKSAQQAEMREASLIENTRSDK